MNEYEHCAYCDAYARSISVYDEPVCFYHLATTELEYKESKKEDKDEGFDITWC